jgi:hypothetical protein
MSHLHAVHKKPRDVKMSEKELECCQYTRLLAAVRKSLDRTKRFAVTPRQ